MSTCYENIPFPPSLSKNGKIHLARKSDLLDMAATDVQSDPPTFFDVKLLYGAPTTHY